MRKVLLFLLNSSLAIVISVSGVMAQTPGMYVVQPGDSLIRIAKKTGTTVEALVEANKATYACLATKPTCLQIGWVLTLPGVTPSPTPPPTVADSGATPAVHSNALQEMRQAVASEVNRLRSENGVTTLAWDETVGAFAQERSQDMASRNYISHYDPETRELLARRLQPLKSYVSLCENVFAQWGRPVSTLVRNAIAGWWGSPGHKACLLMPNVTVFGIGIAEDPSHRWIVTLINVQPK